LGYQWFKDGVNLNDGGNISGAQTPTLDLTNAVGADSGGYFVVITNASGSVTSVVATLTVKDPFISTQPVSQSVKAGDTVQLSADADGTPPLNYQWQKDGVDLNNGGNISGAQTTSLKLSNVLGGDSGGYSVIVGNASGSVTSVVATLSVADPFIITRPVGQSVFIGQSAQFSVVAEGTPPLYYQWLKDGISLNDGGNISGAHSTTLTLDDVLVGDAGGYSVIVSTTSGSVTSIVAALSVTGQAPLITTQPVSQTADP
jgi:hypothetical protein